MFITPSGTGTSWNCGCSRSTSRYFSPNSRRNFAKSKCFQGGVQALSRSYLGKIIPAERIGEFYGLMDIFGKGASFVGLAMVSLVSQLTAGITVDVFGITLQNENLAVGSLIILFIIGYLLFCKADQLNKARN